MNSSLAILLMAYGSPETEKDIKAYYTDVRRGNPPSPELLKQLQERYKAIGGKTPLLQITKEQAALLQKRLGIRTFVGMKHWHPYINDAVKEIAQSGATRIIALALAPHYSALSIGGYGKRLEEAVSSTAPDMQITLIKRWGDNPVFIDSLCQRIEQTRNEFPSSDWKDIEVFFSAHSLPEKLLQTLHDPYQAELMQTCNLVAEKLKLPHWQLAFQSAGRTQDAWLGPDVLTQLQKAAQTQTKQILIAPIGFTTDNLEILYDLDIEAAQEAQKLGLICKRIPSANTTPRFIDAIEDVIKPYLTSAVA